MNNLNYVQKFTAGGFTMLNINLTFQPDDATLAWAQGVIDSNPGLPTIISTHDYLNIDGTRDSTGEAIWNGLVYNNPQIFMTLNGHYHGQNQLLSTDAAGNQVAQVVVNYQSDPPYGGNGYLRKIDFNPASGQIQMSSISPVAGYAEKTDSANKFAYTASFNTATNSIAITGLYTVPTPGDANGDGKVDINDLTIVLTNYGQTGMIWSQGDFNADGTVDINDLTIVLINYGQTAGSGIKAVPEPASVVLLGIGAISVLAYAGCYRPLVGQCKRHAGHGLASSLAPDA